MLEFAQNKRQLKWMKRRISRLYKKHHPSLYTCPPLTDSPRICYKDDEHCIEYGFFKGDYTEEDFDWLTDDNWYYPSPLYDCTGEWFTVSIHLHINPNGKTSYVHHMRLDV